MALAGRDPGPNTMESQAALKGKTMTNRIGATSHPRTGDTHAVEAQGLRNADRVMIVRAAGPLDQEVPRGQRVPHAEQKAVLDDAGPRPHGGR